MPTTTDFWTDVHQERQCLLDLLEVLTPEQWDVPSLCTEWRVRDVVGHMVSETHMTVAQAGWGLIRSGFRINRYIAKDAQQRGAAPVAKLLEDFRVAVLCSYAPTRPVVVVHARGHRHPPDGHPPTLRAATLHSQWANDRRGRGSLDQPLLSRPATVPGHSSHRHRRGLVGWQAVWKSPGLSRRWSSPWPAVSPRSTSCKVMGWRPCVRAQMLYEGSAFLGIVDAEGPF